MPLSPPLSPLARRNLPYTDIHFILARGNHRVCWALHPHMPEMIVLSGKSFAGIRAVSDWTEEEVTTSAGAVLGFQLSIEVLLAVEAVGITGWVEALVALGVGFAVFAVALSIRGLCVVPR